MITLQCDRCSKKVAWYGTEELPKGWSDVGGQDLCDNCTKDYNEFRESLDRDLEAKVKDYFSKEDKE